MRPSLFAISIFVIFVIQGGFAVPTRTQIEDDSEDVDPESGSGEPEEENDQESIVLPVVDEPEEIDNEIKTDEGVKDPVKPPTLAHDTAAYAHAKNRRSGQSFFSHDRIDFLHQEFVSRPVSTSSPASGNQVSTVQLKKCVDDILCDSSTKKYRTFDGSCNNLKHPSWGQAGIPYRRKVPRKHTVIDCGNPALIQLPNPRLTSRLLAKRGENDVSNDFTIMLMLFGQVVDHDVQLTPLRQTEDGEFLDCCEAVNRNSRDCCPIRVPSNDHFFGKNGRPSCMPFLRSKLTKQKGKYCHRLPDVENTNSAWLDVSFVYGSTDDVVLNLRDTNRGGGRMKITESSQSRPFPFVNASDGTPKMVFGDNRGDVHPAFTLMSTVFLRNHNLLAKKLQEQHPDWNDEQLFQEARKINIGMFQHITYTQFVDALMGTPNDIRTRDQELFRNYYNSDTDGSINLIFSTAAFRLHTYVSGSLQLFDENYNHKESWRLRDVFHHPLKLLEGNNYDDLMRGMCKQSLQEFNNVYSKEMTEWLFAENDKPSGLDIVSLNVQRGRDHQIQGYTAYKQLCGLGSTRKWSELEDLIPKEHVHRLLHTYRNFDDIDMYVGANMESPVSGTQLGPTVHCLIRQQLLALRNGDRFFYTNPGVFTESQLREIKKTTLSSVLCDNSDNPARLLLPRDVFRKAGEPVACSSLPQFDISPWAN